MHSGKPWQGELSNRRQDGVDYTALLLAIALRQPDGRISNHLQLHEDISERKRLAAELDRHRHRLEEQVAARSTELAEARLPAEATNRANSAVLANMSHEIRTPMSAIIGLNQLLRRDAARPEQAQRLDKIAQASQHLLASINDILDLSKIEAGKVRLEHTPLNLSALFDKVASVIGEVARSKGLQVLIDIDGMPMRLPGDATRLRQALLDYAGKAVKFSDHGSVTLRARLLEGGTDGRLLVRFEVVDNAWASPPTACRACSATSSRPTPAPPASTVAPAWAWPSRAGRSRGRRPGAAAPAPRRCTGAAGRGQRGQPRTGPLLAARPGDGGGHRHGR